jgi:hypothetical protein
LRIATASPNLNPPTTLPFTTFAAGIIIHGGGLNPSTKYLCVLEDADGHTEDLVGVVNSPEEIECGKAPSGFKVEEDGPVSIVTVTLVYKANDVSPLPSPAPFAL